MMMRYILIILFLTVSTVTWANEGGAIEGLTLERAPINRFDMESIKRGAKFFATNCLSCHTMVYMRYDDVAKAAGVTYEKMPINVKSWPYGVTPPDLSLEAGIRGPDWIYTYLHSFYVDAKRPTGVNNLLVPNTAMPNIVGPYQGEQQLLLNPEGDLFHQIQWYDALKLNKPGTMSSTDFDATIADVTNFLAYATEPYYVKQHTIGWWVIGFLLILLVMFYFLKKEYWKDVKKLKE